MMIKKIGVVGAGTMGNGIAQVFAQSGFDVCLVDTSDAAVQRGRGMVEKSLSRFVQKGTLSAADRDASLSRLATDVDLDRLAESDYIVEAIYEDAQAKNSLFARLDALARPDVI